MHLDRSTLSPVRKGDRIAGAKSLPIGLHGEGETRSCTDVEATTSRPSGSDRTRYRTRLRTSIILIAGQEAAAPTLQGREARGGGGRLSTSRYIERPSRDSIDDKIRHEQSPWLALITRRHRRPSYPIERSGTGPPTWQYASYASSGKALAFDDDDNNASLARS